MADNTTLNPGSGGDVIATDDIGGVKYQVVKNAFGVADAVTPVDTTAGLPVQGQTTAASGSLGAANDQVVIACAGAGIVAIGITGVFTLTWTVEGSIDGGATYPQVVAGLSMSGGQATFTSTTSTNVLAHALCAGLTHIRIRCSAYTSGTAAVVLRSYYGATFVNGGSLGAIAAGVIPGTSSTSLGKAEDAAHTSGDTGVFMLGVRNDNDATFSSTDLDYTPVNVDGTGRVRTITRVSSSTVGNTHSIVSANTTNATSVKATAGNVYVISCSNLNAAVRYLKMYNKASAPTVGTDTPLFRFAIPPNSAGFNVTFPNPLPFSTGIAYALTTGITDADATAVAASEILINLLYA